MEVTIQLPEDLVRRARAVGIDLTIESDNYIAFIEDAIRRRQAARHLLEIGDRLSALPDELKPTDDDITAARDAHWKAS